MSSINLIKTTSTCRPYVSTVWLKSDPPVGPVYLVWLKSDPPVGPVYRQSD